MNNILSSSAATSILRKIMPSVLLLCFVSICFFSQFSNSVTVDEFVHFPAGIYILKTMDWRMDHPAPPLVKCFPAVSAIFTHPEIETKLFQKYQDLYGLGYRFMEKNKDRYRSIFTYGRSMIISCGNILKNRMPFRLSLPVLPWVWRNSVSLRRCCFTRFTFSSLEPYASSASVKEKTRG